MSAEQLQLIRDVSQIIAGTTDFHEGLRQAVARLANFAQTDACNIFAYDNRRGQLVMEATYGLAQSCVHRVQLSAQEGINGVCYDRREILNVSNLGEEEGYGQDVEGWAAGFGSVLAVPLQVGGRAIGVLNLCSSDSQEIGPRALNMVLAISAPLAVFVSNGRLSEEASEHEKAQQKTEPQEIMLRGTAITGGVVRGRAYFLAGSEALDTITRKYASDVEAEKSLFQKALSVAREDTIELQQEASKILAEADAGIFYAHLLLLDDPTLLWRVNNALERRFKLRFALKVVIDEMEEEFRRLDNEIVRERLADMKDVVFRIYQAVEEIDNVTQRPKKLKSLRSTKRPIVVTRELLPSQLIRLPLANLAGIVSESGGMTSHVAILARTLQIPMVVGVKGALANIRKNDDVILDCSDGSCHVRPTRQVVKHFGPALRFHARPKVVPAAVCELSATADGTPIRLGGNISLINELPLLERYGAMGVGLYRTEFMFMIRNLYPTEDEQYNVFRSVVKDGGGSSVTIRILDVGGDKPLPYVNFGREDNPALGWRGMRFLLSNPQYLAPHLRAILRTTVHGRVNILLPMVADLDELLLAKKALRQAEADLEKGGIPYSRNYRLGVMFEVPSAFWALPEMLEHIDFVSIGSNDLIQYLFAVDRGNSRVTGWFRQFHPVVLRVIAQVCELVARHPGKTVSLCGEMAGNPLGVAFLIGAGLRHLSMNPWRIPGVRQAISQLKVADCQDILSRALRCNCDAEVVVMMHEFAEAHGLE